MTRIFDVDRMIHLYNFAFFHPKGEFFKIIILAILIFSFFWFRIQNIRRQKRILESLVKKRTATIIEQKEQIEKQKEEIEKEKEKEKAHDSKKKETGSDAEINQQNPCFQKYKT